ncbi:CNK3/IPCEF1 fusion protein-like isoform X1 [Mytilus californianus]|uniref:CNK3/IPCEF1 fusion protein-like isoform X1 n=1 Tax=Mytilus californianus TaxID=6549 RepID=UPI002245A02F|nr:CNK3/IPCEF1 fusion protein-like isoform X1 [Mytilus californianus]
MAMTFVNHILYENWSPALVSDWIKGLDEATPQYADLILEHGIGGRKLLMLTHYDLEKIGINKLGHQELILEAVDLLKTLRYGYDTENLQYLALQLGCKAKSLQREVQASSSENNPNAANVSKHSTSHDKLSVNILSSVSDLITSLKSIVNWLDRTPFEAIYELCLVRNSIVKIGIELVSNSQRETQLTDIENNIIKSCDNLSKVCDELVIKNRDPLVIQPTSLEIAIIRKKPGEELGITIQSAYYGIHVVGGIKEMSPADLCGKIEKGDEVIQVNNRTVVGWQLKSLVNILKEKPKEVTLLLKKRPHHINPYGQVPNKRKQMNKHHAQQISTLPKSLKKRRSREGEPKNPRPSLQEFVNPGSNLLSVVGDENENASDDKEDINDITDDGNDTDNDVFRSGSESPQYTLPVVTNTQHRRATVSGGSPTLSRTLLIIEDPDTPTRPKSFTITASDIPQIELETVPGDENGFSKFGDKNKVTAQQKRQDFKQTKSVPQSMEYGVKSDTSKADNTRTLQNLKKTVALLEVPSHFQTPPRCVVSDSMDSLDEQWNNDFSMTSSQETLTELTAKISTLTTSANENDTIDDENENEADFDNLVNDDGCDKEVSSVTHSEDKSGEEATQAIKGILKHCDNEEKEEKTCEENSLSDSRKQTQNTELDQKIQEEVKKISQSRKEHDKKEISGSDNFQTEHVRKENSERDKNIAGVHDIDEERDVRKQNNEDINHLSSSIKKQQSSLPKSAPKDLDATFVDYDRHWNTRTTLAHEHKHKNEPQLVKIRKLDSVTAVDRENKKIEGNSTQKDPNGDDQSQVSYTTIIVGGVPQKIPINKAPQMEIRSTKKYTMIRSLHSVTMRRKTRRGGTDLNRRVSCKDLGQGDCEGWLYKKRSDRGGAFSSKWVKRWCVMKNYNLFYYKNKVDQKAEGVIHLPAFQVSPAPEVKTSKYAFKIHNLGTSFLFSSDRQEDMKKWMNKMGLAAIAYDEKKVTEHAIFPHVRRPNDNHDIAEFSESDDETLDSANTSNTSKDTDSSGHGSPDIRSRLPVSEDDEVVFRNRGSGCSSFTTGSLYSCVPTEFSDNSESSTVTGFSQSTDDLTHIYRTLESEHLTFDGKDKQKQRRSAIKSESSGDGLPSGEQVEKVKKLHSLERTLKAKEQELEAIDRLLVDGMGADTLKRYQDHFLLSASMRSLPTQSDSDEESS